MNGSPTASPFSETSQTLTYIVRPRPNDVAAFSILNLRLVLFTDGPDVVNAMTARRPDLLIVNVTGAYDDSLLLCSAATRMTPPAPVLAICANVTSAPPALRAGCNAVLIPPITRNLVAGRISRLLNSRAGHSGAFAPDDAYGPVVCPECQTPRPIGFDAVGLRRWWFACLACNHTWIAAVNNRRSSVYREAVRVSTSELAADGTMPASR